MSATLAVAVAAVVLAVVGISLRMRVISQRGRDKVRGDGGKRTAPAHTMVVMGSGGHTGEMMHFLRRLPQERYTPRTYVVARTDTVSGARVVSLEEELGQAADRGTAGRGNVWSIAHIFRAREVGQSLVTSVFTTVIALVHAVWIVARARPDLLVTNGPGTAVPLAFAAYFWTVRTYDVPFGDVLP